MKIIRKANDVWKESGLLDRRLPSEQEYGSGLDQEAMNLLFQYDITNSDLWRYDSSDSTFPDIYEGIQAAKQGDNHRLQEALEARFGKKRWFDKRLV